MGDAKRRKDLGIKKPDWKDDFEKDLDNEELVGHCLEAKEFLVNKDYVGYSSYLHALPITIQFKVARMTVVYIRSFHLDVWESYEIARMKGIEQMKQLGLEVPPWFKNPEKYARHM